MLTEQEIIQGMKNIDFLIANADNPASSFKYHGEENKITKNWLHETNQTILEAYLQSIIDKLTEAADYKNSSLINLRASLDYFLNLKESKLVQSLHLELKNLERQTLSLERLGHQHQHNKFFQNKTIDNLPKIKYDPYSHHYTSPDDDKAHQHGAEAANIFFSTQFERFKGLISKILAVFGIHVLESARYQEHDYLDSDIYTHDTPTAGPKVKKIQHYWVGHATNYFVFPNNGKPLHVITDPFEGDMAPLIYPRMTAEGRLIEGEGDTRLPKVDVVVISHNHPDHVSEPTLKRLVNQQPKMIVPQGDKELFTQLGFKHVVELEWWEQARITAAVNDPETQVSKITTDFRITAVPARHWSGRGLGDAHRSAFNGYVFSNSNDEGDIYFAGDTALMDDSLSQPIFDQFDIKTSIQPGGPDENRADMESTHQSSADGILMHFKMLVSHYKKMMKKQVEIPTISEFMHSIASIKTIYNHTATFKLGNLRLKDTDFSYQRLVAAFKEDETWRQLYLKPHEMESYQMILQLTQQMMFKAEKKISEELIMPLEGVEEKLTAQQVATLILDSVVIPKIGQRQSLDKDSKGSKHSFEHRNLITNRRALIEFDQIVENYIHKPEQKDFDVKELKELIVLLLDSYQDPWYSLVSRTLKPENYRDRYLGKICECRDLPSLTNVLNLIETEMNGLEANENHENINPTKKLNQDGHMQSFIHYFRWLISFQTQHDATPLEKLKEYFSCQQIRKLADQEVHNSGWFFETEDRSSKQKAFRTLGEYFAKVPADKYKRIFESWLEEHTDGEQNRVLIAKRRSRQDKKDEHGEAEATHSTKILGEINTLVSKGFFGESPLKPSKKEHNHANKMSV